MGCKVNSGAGEAGRLASTASWAAGQPLQQGDPVSRFWLQCWAFQGSCQFVLAAVLASLQDLPQGEQVQGQSWTVMWNVQGRVQCRYSSSPYARC